MTPAEQDATDAIRIPLQNAQSAVWRNNLDGAVQSLFSTLVPELKGASLSCIYRIIEVSNVVTRAASEQLVSQTPQSLNKLAMNNVECASLSDAVLIEQIIDESAYIYSDIFRQRPMPEDNGSNRTEYQPGYVAIDAIIRLNRAYALLCEHPQFLSMSEEELSALVVRIDPILSGADYRLLAEPREDSHKLS